MIENSEQFDTMSRREKKMQERWSTSIKTENSEQPSTKPLIGIEFPQISVLRKKFAPTSSPTNKKEIDPDATETEVSKILLYGNRISA